MAMKNPLRQLWQADKSIRNGWLAIPSVLSAEIMARAGWDSLTIDMQHGTADYADVLSMLPVIQQTGTVPMVRVPWNDPAHIMRVLDAGALGVICPMIEGAEDASRFVASCLYPPQGARSFGPIRARLAWGNGYGAAANAEILSLAMIETRKAVAALDDILAVPGLGGIYIGPADLASDHGFPPAFDRTEPEMLALIERIRAAAQAKGLLAGIHCGTPDYAARMAEAGFDLVTIASDARFMEAGAAAALSAFGAVRTE